MNLTQEGYDNLHRNRTLFYSLMVQYGLINNQDFFYYWIMLRFFHEKNYSNVKRNIATYGRVEEKKRKKERRNLIEFKIVTYEIFQLKCEQQMDNHLTIVNDHRFRHAKRFSIKSLKYLKRKNWLFFLRWHSHEKNTNFLYCHLIFLEDSSIACWNFFFSFFEKSLIVILNWI